MSILISGSLVNDHIMDFPDRFKNHLLVGGAHILNVCFMVEKLQKSRGGTGGNIAYSLKMLGADPVLVSSVGQDGEEYLKYLEELGIDTGYVNIDKERLTASCYITTDLDDNQITAFHNGALESSINISEIENKFDLAIIAPTQKDIMLKHLNECVDLGIKTVFDIGQQITAFNNDELRQAIIKADIIIGNDHEMNVLQKRLEWSAVDILKYVDIIITTLGGQGSRIETKDGLIEIGVCPVESALDPTGAGDAYRAGFFAAYALGKDLKTCGQTGAVAAAYAVEKQGTQNHSFTKDEFVKRYKNIFNEKLKL